MAFHKAALALGALVVSLGVSKADTRIYSAAIPSQDAPFRSTFTLPKFNDDLGTLTAITLSLTATTQASITIFNLNADDEPFTDAAAEIPLTVNGPASTAIVATPTATVASGTAVPGLNRFPGLSGSASSSIIVPLSGFAAYTGVGSDTATFTASAGKGSYSGTGNVGLLFGGSAVIGGTATITYTFVAAGTAPEPSALALMGLGFVLSAAVARRASASGARRV